MEEVQQKQVKKKITKAKDAQNAEVIQAQSEFNAYTKNLETLIQMKQFREVEETTIRVSGYNDRSGFRLVTHAMMSPEQAKQFYKYFLNDLTKRYPTLTLLNCTRHNVDNHLEFLIVSKHIV